MRLPNLTRLTIGALLVASLSGCVPADPAPPQPSATFVAPYASDEEALAAAEAAYGEYLNAVNTALRTGVVEESVFESVTTGSELSDAIAVYSRIASEGKRSTADITFDQVTLQRYSTDESAHEVITIYLCEDLSKAFLVDESGERVKTEDVPPRTMQVTFDYSTDHDGLLLTDRQIWDDAPC
ncbi:hypothetical protein ESZ53_04155 [Salinibacterium sp. UTAS2018]|uniref:hypothetical protein n=1 Tax=Salinibacterium sp. UTAS2018 TaxID=2508880 RepID=UPI0010097F9D|nr:hypothetical protein [Salinibacterium sp. UTAS2018]QAV69703.1 hypothetical protein ESZ53_04155 [Salinibacterium sp. UTAS2018]